MSLAYRSLFICRLGIQIPAPQSLSQMWPETSSDWFQRLPVGPEVFWSAQRSCESSLPLRTLPKHKQKLPVPTGSDFQLHPGYLEAGHSLQVNSAVLHYYLLMDFIICGFLYSWRPRTDPPGKWLRPILRDPNFWGIQLYFSVLETKIQNKHCVIRDQYKEKITDG